MRFSPVSCIERLEMRGLFSVTWGLAANGVIDDQSGTENNFNGSITVGGAASFQQGMESYDFMGSFTATSSGGFSGFGEMMWLPTQDPYTGHFGVHTDYSISTFVNSNGTYSVGFNIDASGQGSETSGSFSASFSSGEFTAAAGFNQTYTSDDVSCTISATANSSGNFSVGISVTYQK